MSMSSPDVPKVPDPTMVANQQQQLNKDMLASVQAASNVNQQTPTGSLTYTQTGTGPGGVPTYTATQTLSPAEQALLTTMQGTQGTAGRQAGAVLAGANYGSTNPADVIGGATSGTTKTLLGQETSYLDPYFKNQTEQLDATLRAQGIFPDQKAYQDQMMQLQGRQNQAITGFLATAEPEAYKQAVSTYGLPAELSKALMSVAQPAGLGLTSTPQASGSPADLVGATSSANAANMAAYNAKLAQQQNMMTGLFGLGSAAISGGSGGFGNSLLGTLAGLAPVAAV